MIVINGSVSDEVKALLLAGKSHPSARIHGNLIIPGGSGAGGGKSYADMLYEHFGVDRSKYPYITLRRNSSGELRVFFSEDVSGNTIGKFLYINELWNKVNYKVDEVVDYIMENYARENLYGGSSFTMKDVSSYYYYTNYDLIALTGYTASKFYRLDQ